jgi:hypothetical protein
MMIPVPKKQKDGKGDWGRNDESIDSSVLLKNEENKTAMRTGVKMHSAKVPRAAWMITEFFPFVFFSQSLYFLQSLEGRDSSLEDAEADFCNSLGLVVLGTGQGQLGVR